MKKLIATVTVAFVLAGYGRVVQADEQDEARAAFDQGIEAFQNEDFEVAVKAFRRAYELSPSWKLKYNIGQCEAALKHFGLAIEAFEHYLSVGGDEVVPARREETIAELKRLREMVGSLDVSAPAGAVIIVNKTVRGEAPLSGVLKVPAGIEHQLRVELEGQVILERGITVSGGDTVRVDASAEGGSPSQPLAEPPVEDGRAHSVLWPTGWVMLGTGVAAGIVGAVVSGRAKALDDELQSDCPNDVCPPGKHDELDRQKQLGVTGAVLLGTGGLLAGVGATLLIIDVVRDPESAGSDAAIAPAFGPGYSGVVITGRF